MQPSRSDRCITREIGLYLERVPALTDRQRCSTDPTRDPQRVALWGSTRERRRRLAVKRSKFRPAVVGWSAMRFGVLRPVFNRVRVATSGRSLADDHPSSLCTGAVGTKGSYVPDARAIYVSVVGEECLERTKVFAELPGFRFRRCCRPSSQEVRGIGKGFASGASLLVWGDPPDLGHRGLLGSVRRGHGRRNSPGLGLARGSCCRDSEEKRPPIDGDSGHEAAAAVEDLAAANPDGVAAVVRAVPGSTGSG